GADHAGGRTAGLTPLPAGGNARCRAPAVAPRPVRGHSRRGPSMETRRMRRNPIAPIVPAIAAALLALAGSAHAAEGERLLTAARIHTSDAATPLATAMVWDADGRILAVGDVDELLARHADAERIDAGDATVVPGLIDAHAHLVGLGQALMQADLVGARSTGEI